MIKQPIYITLIVTMFLILNGVYGKTEKYYKIDQRIILQEGLSQSRILCILEDSRGFMWFGTADGLNRYDGYDFKIFRNIVNDSTSLSNNYISTLIEDDDGNIWIGTKDGIALFNPYTEVFKSYKEPDPRKAALGADNILACAIDNQDNIWCALSGGGYAVYNGSGWEIDDDRFKETGVFAIEQAKDDKMWIGTGDGVFIND